MPRGPARPGSSRSTAPYTVRRRPARGRTRAPGGSTRRSSAAARKYRDGQDGAGRTPERVVDLGRPRDLPPQGGVAVLLAGDRGERLARTENAHLRLVTGLQRDPREQRLERVVATQT